MLLKHNGITLNECLKNNPFQCKPFQIKNSFEFIEAVKYDKFKEMEIYLKNPDLLFSFDYYRQTGFHWAAKKNKLKGARIMTKYGNCVNQIEPMRMCEWAERGGDGCLHWICPKWERRTDERPNQQTGGD